MVIATSDSTGTLVSLDGGKYNYQGYPLLVGSTLVQGEGLRSSEPTEIRFCPSALYLPEDDEDSLFDEDEDDFDEGSYYSCTYDQLPQPTKPSRPLFLPVLDESCDEQPNNQSERAADTACVPPPVDACLPRQLVDAADDLVTRPVVHYTSQSRERVLYVAQGEVAHAGPLQCDVLVSDRATTCHIVALRSDSDSAVPLTTLAHIDGTSYEECLRDAILRHSQHHEGRRAAAPAPASTKDNKIDMDVHMVGGFVHETSRKISNWLLRTLSQIASEYEDSMTFTLRTCAISSLNDSGSGDPILRGMGIDLRSGRVFAAKVDASLIPCSELRSARLFQRGSRTLSCIHDETSNDLIVAPFAFEPFSNADVLLSLDDTLLLRCTSTSPHCEEGDFCASLRSTLLLLRDATPSSVFGKRIDEPVRLRRAGRSNAWKNLRQRRGFLF